jgi:hypothetical protein
MDTPADSTSAATGAVDVGPRSGTPFTIPEIRGHLGDLRDAHPDNSAVADVLDIVEAMLVHHDCDQPVPSGATTLAPVIPLPSRR